MHSYTLNNRFKLNKQIRIQLPIHKHLSYNLALMYFELRIFIFIFENLNYVFKTQRVKTSI